MHKNFKSESESTGLKLNQLRKGFSHLDGLLTSEGGYKEQILLA